MNSNQKDDLFLKQLIALAKTCGLAMTEPGLQARIEQSVKVQQACGINNFSVLRRGVSERSLLKNLPEKPKDLIR